MIFVSFRDESAHPAGRLGHLLSDRFGSEEVFLADSVVAGSDSAAATDSALRQCTAAVVVVDPTWAAAVGPVIRQVSSLIERGVALLPVLVDGARPPRADDLPECVRGLARLQAMRLDHLTFRSDTDQVSEWIEKAIHGEPPPPRRPREQRSASPVRPVPLFRTIWRIALWWMVFIFAIPTGIGVFHLVLGRDQSHLLGAAIALTVIQILLLGGSTLALRREIAAQRLMIDRAGSDARLSSEGRATSRGRVWFVTGACVVVAVLIGWTIGGLP
jgi:hypothetical protein